MLEEFVNIPCGKSTITGIIHHPNTESPSNTTTGFIIVSGGIQTRVGSHRQYVKLCRALAKHGVSCLRYDHFGVGDSLGEFSDIKERAEQLRELINYFNCKFPMINDIILWGLCDGASTILAYLNSYDSRVKRVILLNPWVKLPSSEINVLFSFYYPHRLLKFDFWYKFLIGKINYVTSINKFIYYFLSKTNLFSERNKLPNKGDISIVESMLTGFCLYSGKVTIICADTDFTGREFIDVCRKNPQWNKCLSNSAFHLISNANHTFSSSDAHNQLMSITINYVLKESVSAEGTPQII